jgi:hypothetical protein
VQRLFMSLVLIIMFLIAGLTAAPLLVNVDGYKSELIATIKASTGLDPVINGTVNISFLPAPSIAVTNVSIPNVKDGVSANIVSIESVEVRSSFKALFSGKIDIRKVELIRPVIELEEFPDNTHNWSMITEALKARDVSGKFQFPDDIVIKNGTVTHSDKGKKTTIDYVNANISADSVNGPFAMDGSFSNDAHVIKFTGYVGELRQGAKAEFSISSDSFAMELNGKYEAGDEPKIEGEMKGNATDLKEFVNSFFDSKSFISKIKSSEKMGLEGKFLLSSQMISFNDIKIDSESLGGNASIDALFGGKEEDFRLQWDVGLNIDKINFDKLLTQAQDPKKKGKEGEVDYYASTMDNTSIADFKFDMPQNLSALLNFSIKEITYNNDKIQNLRVEADIFEGNAVIKSITADLPGSSLFKFTGNIDHNGTRPLLHGKAELSGGNFRTLITWLKPEAAFIPEKEMGEYIIAGDLEMTPQRIDFYNGNISVDKTLVVADISLRPAATVPVIKADFKIDRLDLDRYHFTDKINEYAADFNEHAATTEIDHSWLQMIGIKLDLSIDANDLVYNGYDVNNSVITLGISRGIFDLQRFVVNSDVSTFSSRVYINTADETPRMDIAARANNFDTALFIPKKEKKADEKFQWSNDPFNFMGIGRFAGRTNIALANFRHNNLLMQNLVLEGEMNKQIFAIKKAGADLYGGKIVVNGSIGVNEATPSIGISTVLSNVDLAPLVKNFTETSETTGKVFFSGTIKTLGKSPASWVTNLVTDAKVSGRNIAFNKFDLESIITKSHNLFSVIDMDGVVKDASENGFTVFDSVDGKVATADGILKATDFQLATKLSRGVFAGNVSLVNLGINGIAKIGFRPEAGKNVTLGVSLKGTLDNVARTLDTTQLEQYITDKGSKKR